MSSEVDHPKHYNDHPSGVECITIIEHFNFNLGNAVKYIWRSGLKGNRIVDLEKAAWYLNREIGRLRKSLHEEKARPGLDERVVFTKADLERLFSSTGQRIGLPEFKPIALSQNGSKAAARGVRRKTVARRVRSVTG